MLQCFSLLASEVAKLFRNLGQSLGFKSQGLHLGYMTLYKSVHLYEPQFPLNLGLSTPAWEWGLLS